MKPEVFMSAEASSRSRNHDNFNATLYDNFDKGLSVFIFILESPSFTDAVTTLYNEPPNSEHDIRKTDIKNFPFTFADFASGSVVHCTASPLFTLNSATSHAWKSLLGFRV